MAIKEADAAKLIMSSAAEATKAHAAMAGPMMAAAVVAPADFCGLWKTAKPVLETAATILGFIAPPVAGTLRGLIKIGDQIATGMGCA